MKKDYFAIWSLLAVSFLLFFGLSMCDDIHIDWHVKSSGMADALLAPVDSVATAADIATDAGSDTVVADTVESQQTRMSTPAQAYTPVSNDTTARTVLFIGDSMVECLGPRMGAYCSAYGHKLYNVIWYSSSTELYAKSKLITDYIRFLQPDFIFISLGGNELFIRDIIEKRTPYVKSILAEIGDIPYIWIGPPNWKKDTGINEMLANEVKPGCLFVSDGLKLGRKKDGAHPNAESSIVWMDSIARWIPLHARYKLPLVKPEKKTDRATKQYLHQPGELTHRPINNINSDRYL